MASLNNYMFQHDSDVYKASEDLMGQGLRGMFGKPNEEEQLEQQKKDVDAIVKAADFNTDEGKAKALNDIKAVSTDAWMAFSKELNAMQTSDLALTAKKRTPELKAEWRLDVGKKYSSRWASETLPGQPQGLDTEDSVTEYLIGLTKAGTIDNRIKNDWLKLYRSNMKSKGEAYVSNNATREATKDGLISSKDVFNTKNKSKKVDPATIRDTSGDSLVDTYVNVPVGQGATALAESGKTVLDYITSGGLQNDVLGKDISDAINKYINQPLSNLTK